MSEVYRLAEPLDVEYEWNKGPRPSGYAYLKLSLEPDESDLQESLKIVDKSDGIWRMRSDREEPNQALQDARGIWGDYIEVLREGVREGAIYALTHSLDRPVIGVKVVLEQATADRVYSTKMAFHMAARSAIEQALTRAAEERSLELVEV